MSEVLAEMEMERDRQRDPERKAMGTQMEQGRQANQLDRQTENKLGMEDGLNAGDLRKRQKSGSGAAEHKEIKDTSLGKKNEVEEPLHHRY